MANIFGIKNLPYKMVKMYDTSQKGRFYAARTND